MSSTIQLPDGLQYHFNIIYNNAKSPRSRTNDTDLSTHVAKYIDGKLRGWGYDKGFYSDRDDMPGRNVITEFFRVREASKWTIVVLTPGFLTNCWRRYCQMSAFKELLDDDKPHRLVPIALNLAETEIPKELRIQNVLFLTENWETACETEWEKLKQVLRDEVRVETANRQPVPANSQECGDNVVRSENQGQFVVHPASQTSMDDGQYSLDGSMQMDGDPMDSATEQTTTESGQNFLTFETESRIETEYTFDSLPAEPTVVINVTSSQTSQSAGSIDVTDGLVSRTDNGLHRSTATPRYVSQMSPASIMTIQASPTVTLSPTLPTQSGQVNQHVVFNTEPVIARFIDSEPGHMKTSAYTHAKQIEGSDETLVKGVIDDNKEDIPPHVTTNVEAHSLSEDNDLSFGMNQDIIHEMQDHSQGDESVLETEAPEICLETENLSLSSITNDQDVSELRYESTSGKGTTDLLKLQPNESGNPARLYVGHELENAQTVSEHSGQAIEVPSEVVSDTAIEQVTAHGNETSKSAKYVLSEKKQEKTRKLEHSELKDEVSVKPTLPFSESVINGKESDAPEYDNFGANDKSRNEAETTGNALSTNEVHENGQTSLHLSGNAIGPQQQQPAKPGNEVTEAEYRGSDTINAYDTRCSDDTRNSSDTRSSGDTTRLADTANSGDTTNLGDTSVLANTANSGDTTNLGDTAVSGDTTNLGDTSVLANTANSGDTTSLADTAVSGDVTNLGDTANSGDTLVSSDTANLTDTANSSDASNFVHTAVSGDTTNLADTANSDDKTDTGGSKSASWFGRVGNIFISSLQALDESHLAYT